jgi:hypothetical protein
MKQLLKVSKFWLVLPVTLGVASLSLIAREFGIFLPSLSGGVPFQYAGLSAFLGLIPVIQIGSILSANREAAGIFFGRFLGVELLTLAPIPFAAGLLLLVGKLAPDIRDTALVSGLNLLGYGALFLLCLDIGAGRYSSGFCVGFFVTTALFGHGGGHIHGWAWPLQPRPHAEAVAFVILLVIGAAIRRAWAFKNA